MIELDYVKKHLRIEHDEEDELLDRKSTRLNSSHS